ncbi:MAG: AlpA family transcriptional regulator [Bdellovibrionales bacterium]
MSDIHSIDERDCRVVVDDSPPALRVLRLPDVIARVGLKRASIYLHIGKGTFPGPISLGPRAVGWLEHEVEAWLAARVQMRRGSGGKALNNTASKTVC